MSTSPASLPATKSAASGEEQPAASARPELLAPAGDWECARAAVENGADAIYFGLDRFNARMRARNFTQSDLPPLMDYLHRRGVRAMPLVSPYVADEPDGPIVSPDEDFAQGRSWWIDPALS